MKKSSKILIISGPTASGKSELAKIIAQKINGIIINADSMQLYKELPILSSQPTKPDLANTEHFLYSIFKYDQDSSVAIWLNLVREILDQNDNSKLPIIVGGTGLYISRLLHGISLIPEIDFKIKIQSRNLYEEIGREEFIKILIDKNENKNSVQNLDKQRLIRRFEVISQTGKSLDYWQLQPNQNIFSDKSFLHINLEPDREELYQNCNLRFEKMLKNGAIEEVKELIKLSPPSDLPITKTIGYFEIKDYLNNLINLEEAREVASQKTRNYAKRQLTWFRNQFKDKITFDNPGNSVDKILDLLCK